MPHISRTLTRRLLYQKLFIFGFTYISDEIFFQNFYFDNGDLEVDKVYFEEMQKIILDKEGIFILFIERYAPKFNIEKMSLLYVLPIYIALAEMFFLQEEIPAKVSINEAIELAKIFSDDPVKKIVNGVLNNVFNDYEKLNNEINSIEIKNDFTFFKFKV
ncbi:MAG: transcription antitermination factor NusB [Candidatus Gracilibacteria bacterium]